MNLFNDNYQDLFSKIDYKFSNLDHLVQALTHRSYCAEHDDTNSNERLEFLGDSVLGLVVTDNIYKNYPDLREGELAKLRASVVNTEALASIAIKLDLGSYIFLGKGEDQSGGRTKRSILADSVEALIGAIYIDSGWQEAAKVVLNLTIDSIEKAATKPGRRDYKTRLQELSARLNLGSPTYILVGSGPDHDKKFVATTVIDGVEKGSGEGTSKKRAEQMAAQNTYEELLGKITDA